jgi:flagellar protein FlgJ
MIDAVKQAYVPYDKQPIEAPRQNLEKDRLFDACKDFEALFIKQMLDSMRNTVQKTGLIDGGMAENIFEDMLYDEYSKIMSKTASFGIAELMYRDLSS